MNQLPYFLAAWLFFVGLYGMVTTRNFLHLVMCLGVLQASTYVLLLEVGYRAGGTAPIFNAVIASTSHGGSALGAEAGMPSTPPLLALPETKLLGRIGIGDGSSYD